MKLADRIKHYESLETSQKFIPTLPIIIRLDGRSFSNLTRKLVKPYDERMSRTMQEVTKYLVKETGAKIGYTQSDEITLVLNSDKFESDVFFSYKKSKLISVIASLCSVKFNSLISDIEEFNGKLPVFDCRAFQVPSKEEATNAILSRVQDATRNSLQMATSKHYSQKQMHGKNVEDMHEMLYSIGINWNDYPKFFKEGSFFKRISKEYTNDVGAPYIRHVVEEVIPGKYYNELDIDEKKYLIFS